LRAAQQQALGKLQIDAGTYKSPTAPCAPKLAPKDLALEREVLVLERSLQTEAAAALAAELRDARRTAADQLRRQQVADFSSAVRASSCHANVLRPECCCVVRSFDEALRAVVMPPIYVAKLRVALPTSLAHMRA
jgi:hypothetical protein